MKIALLNTTICTGGAGNYRLSSITLDDAKALINEGVQQDNGDCITSYIGHESTAQIMGTLLEVPVAMNRAQFRHDAGTVALCFKLNGRPEEGKILTADEIEAIGYEWFSMTFVPA